MQIHDVQRFQPRQCSGEHRRDDREVFGHVVGNGEGRQRAAGHEQLLTDLHDLDELGGVAIEVHHVARFLGGLRARVHGHADIGLGQGGGIVGAVAHHGHELPVGLLLADVGELGFRRGLGDEIIDPRLRGDRLGRERVVAGDHHGPQAHPPQTREPLGDARFKDVFQHHHPRDAAPVADQQRRGPFRRHCRHYTVCRLPAAAIRSAV